MTQPLISSKVLTGKNPQGFKEYGLEFNSFSDFNKYLWIYCGKKSCKHKESDKPFQYSSNVSIRERIQEKSHTNVKNMSKLWTLLHGRHKSENSCCWDVLQIQRIGTILYEVLSFYLHWRFHHGGDRKKVMKCHSINCASSLHSFLHKHWRIHTWENSTVAMSVAKPLTSFKP